jgi:serine/threonine protein kinase
VKLVKKDTIVQAIKKEKLVREITILKHIKHRFIVNLYEVLETDSYIGMAMEYASGGELFNHILAKKRLKESEAARFFTQLIIGVSYLHSKGIVHRDLKLENLLLDRNRNIIITDFGFANRVSIDGDSFLSTSCGSPCYAAPELVINECYSGEAADIWSCGVILYAMICGYLPFDDDPKNQDGENINLLYEYILKTELNFPKHTSVLAKSLINRILVTSPSERATIQEIKMHRWLEPMRMLFLQEEAMHPPAVNKTNEETLRVTTSNDSEILLKKDSSEDEKSPLGVVSATLTERTSISSSKVPNSTAANVDDTSIAFGRKSADARNGAEGYQHQYEIRAQSMDCRGRFVESKGLCN